MDINRTMNTVCPCSLCGERDHQPWRCPVLREPLREGFYRGSGGGGDDEHAAARKFESGVAAVVSAATASITTLEAYINYQNGVHYLQRGDYVSHGAHGTGMRA